MILKTKKQLEREAKDAAVYREWMELTANKEYARTMVAMYLMKKHKLKSRSTIWKMCRRHIARENKLKIN